MVELVLQGLIFDEVAKVVGIPSRHVRTIIEKRNVMRIYVTEEEFEKLVHQRRRRASLRKHFLQKNLAMEQAVTQFGSATHNNHEAQNAIARSEPRIPAFAE